MGGTVRGLKIKPAAIALIVLALVFAVIGVIYLTTAANDLPGFIPGKPDYSVASDRKYTKRGIALLVLSAGALVAAWYTSGLRSRIGKGD